MKVAAAALLVVALFTSCTSVHTSVNPAVDLNRFKHFYVVHRLSDDRHIDALIVAELKASGREASAGPLTMMPDNAEVIVNYLDDWEWDFKTYLLQLNVQLYDVRRDRPIAFGNYRQPTPITKSPPEVIHEIFSRVLKHQ